MGSGSLLNFMRHEWKSIKLRGQTKKGINKLKTTDIFIATEKN